MKKLRNKEGIQMNKLFENKWAVRIISLVFALFIYTFVSNENYSRRAAFNTQMASSVNTSETMYNIPLLLGKHPDDIYVSDLNETVTVKLEGPRNIINQVTRESFIVQTEEISSGDIGQTKLRLKIEGLPQEISYRISPSSVLVDVEKRKAITLPVEYDVSNLQLSSSVKVGSVETDPKQVKLIGKQEVIDAIDFVGIKISSEDEISESFSNTYRLQILDKNGDLLDVNADVVDIKTKVNLEANSKSVPLKVTPIGEDNTKKSYQYDPVDRHSVVLYGRQEDLNQIESVELVVDVSQVEKSQTVTGILNLPTGITGADTNQVNVKVTVEDLGAKESKKE